MELKKVNWSLTLIFCLAFGGLGFIIGSMSNCGKSASCEAPKQCCTAHKGEATKKSCNAHHGETSKKGCSAHHGGESDKKKCCSTDKKCEKHSNENMVIEKEIITEE